MTAEVYKTWARAAGGIQIGIIIIALYALAEIVQVLASFWLSYWSAHRDKRSSWYFLKIYIGINASALVIVIMRDLATSLGGLKASRNLFDKMLGAVLYAPMSFFDTTPLGRILNRFSKVRFSKMSTLCGRPPVPILLICLCAASLGCRDC